MKKFSLIMAIVLLLGAFSACGASDNKTSSDTTSDSAASTQTTQSAAEALKGKSIDLGVWGGNDAETASLDKMIGEFTAKSGIKVNKKVYTDYNTQIKADIAGNVAPDVFYVDAYMAPYFISEGVLAKLDKPAIESEKFYPNLINAFTSNGDIYAIPKDYSTLALYYNKKYVNEADIPKTQEALYSESFLKSVQDKLPKGTIALSYNADMARLLDIMQSGGKDVTKDGSKSYLSNPDILSNLSTVFEAAKAKRVMTPADLGKGWNGEAFGNELCAMMVEGNWVLGYLAQNFPKLDFGVVEVPTYKGNKTSIAFTVGYAVNSKAKEPEAALEYIKYACGTDGMTTWCKGAGVLPSRSDVNESMGMANDPKLAPHIAAAEYATPWQKGVTMDVINKAFQNYFTSAVTGKMTLPDAMKKADDDANNQIQ